MASLFVYWLKVACGPFSGQPGGCFDPRAKGVTFARERAGSRKTVLFIYGQLAFRLIVRISS
jgi:hypothetical protein